MRLVPAAALLMLSACASITTGSTQNVMVQTVPDHDAVCNLSNDHGTWNIPSTPGSASVHRSYSPLSVTCKSGKLHGTASVQSGTKGSALGNIVAGGVIGGAVDMSTGSAYDYPASITVPISAKGSFTEIKPDVPKTDSPKDAHNK